MKRLIAYAAALMLIVALSACATDGNSQRPIDSPAESFPASAPVSGPDDRVGQPIPTNVVPAAAIYPYYDGFFTGAADTYANVPDVSAATGVPPIKLTLGGSYQLLAVTYPVSDADKAIKDVEQLLLTAGFVRNNDVSALLDFTSAPSSGIVLARAADRKFISLSNENGRLVVRYATSGSYKANGKWVELEQTGDSGEEFKGLLFDRSYLDYPQKVYGADVPEPNVPMGTPPYEISIESGQSGVTYLFTIDNAKARAESFRLTMEAAGFKTDSYTIEKAVYAKSEIRVSIKIVDRPDSVFSDAIVTLTKY